MKQSDFIISQVVEKLGEYLEETSRPEEMVMEHLAHLLGVYMDKCEALKEENEYLKKRLSIYESATHIN